MLKRKNELEVLCRQSGNWVVTEVGKNNRHWVTHRNRQSGYSILVLHGHGDITTRFQLWLPIRFPLDRLPDGLCARMMLRSWELSWSCWVLNIGDSCEANACVTALVHNRGLDAALFDAICKEQVGEVAGFQRELREKFNWAGQAGFQSGAPTPAAGPGLPMVRPSAQPPRTRQW